MYEISSEYTKAYSFTLSSNIEFNVKLYDNSMQEIESIIDTNSSSYIYEFDEILTSDEIYYLKESKLYLSEDKQKEIALKNVFVDSRLMLVYGAAGTGKTTLINYISNIAVPFTILIIIVYGYY